MILFPEYRERDWSVLNINVTWRCPIQCTYCHVQKQASRDDRRILPRDVLIRECKLGKEYGIKEFRFSGGEPLTIGDKLFEYAETIYNITGKKPNVLTSGFSINEDWLNKARGIFGKIFLSLENPLEPFHTKVDFNRIMKIVGKNFSSDLPFSYGVTIVSAFQFKNINTIFELMYNSADRHFMPQLDNPCLKNFQTPTAEQLNDIYINTRNLFEKYGLIPYYFVNIIGSPVFLNQDAFRIVINLNPDGCYDHYNSMLESWQSGYKKILYALKYQKENPICQRCEWIDCCKYPIRGELRFDWCELRKAIFQGIYEGLGVDK